jgi:drug/metabolite transporter (DMT)-like permease
VQLDSAVLAALYAVTAAACWGRGDFTGGLGARRFGTFGSVLISYAIGLIALAVIAVSRAEPFPASADLLWGAVAGLSGMMGLSFLFQGFASGRMGIVAPVSAVLGTTLPVIVAVFTEGLPRPLQFIGFALALVGIWLLSRPERLGGRPKGLEMGVLAGLGFAGFFIALNQVSEDAKFWPLVAGRVAAVGAMLLFALIRRRQVNVREAPLMLLILAGIFDAAGNLFFLLALQTGRLDVVAVLGSLYPAVTAILAWLFIKEHLTRLQVVGVGAAITAIVLITL